MPDEAATINVTPNTQAAANRGGPIRPHSAKTLSWKPVVRAIAAATFVLSHTTIAALLIVCMYGTEELMKHLWASEAPLLFERLPLAYLFQAMDLCILCTFGYRGILAASQAFKE